MAAEPSSCVRSSSIVRGAGVGAAVWELTGTVGQLTSATSEWHGRVGAVGKLPSLYVHDSHPLVVGKCLQYSGSVKLLVQATHLLVSSVQHPLRNPISVASYTVPRPSLPAVGVAVGDAVGLAVGNRVGVMVGEAVGKSVGAAVGTEAQTVMPAMPLVHLA